MLLLLPLWHPVFAAEQVGTLAAMTDAPFIVQTGIGAGSDQFDALGANLSTRGRSTDRAIGIMKRPAAAGRGAGGHDFSVLPGQPDASILLYRMDSAEPGIAMPELGKASVDKDGVAVVRRWIAEMQR